MRIRRSLLFMPGDSRRKIEKGTTFAADSLIMDLEDAIALNRKESARRDLAETLHGVDFQGRERLVRINQIIPGWIYTQDIEATIAARPDGYVLPKVDSAEQVTHISELLTRAEQRHGWPLNSIKLLAIIETARGVVNLREIASSDRRLQALIFGAEDLAGDIGAVRTHAGWEVFYARSAVVTHARAYGLQAIDTVFVDLNAPDSEIIAETRRVREMGYTGKLAIHPRQIEPINQVFTPASEEIDAAQRLIDAFNAQQAAGTGVFEYEGRMVDMPMVRAAMEVIRRARACGLLLEEGPR